MSRRDSRRPHKSKLVVELGLGSLTRKLALAVAAAALIVLLYFGAKWSLANMAAAAADDPVIADLTIRLAPDDPQTHFAAAVLFDRTFIPDDLQRSISEYEKAAALSPANYLLWMEYGKALGRGGDAERSERALRRAMDLAPNYFSVKWTLGNALLRSGKSEEGFDLVRQAAAGNPSLAGPAATIAYGYFEGDIERVKAAFGPSAEINSALALLLAREKRFDEAALTWASVPAESGNSETARAGRQLADELIAGGRSEAALAVLMSVFPDAGFAPETIHNAGFEVPIKTQDALAFEWQLSSGTQPQILQSEGQHRSGGKSLVVAYSSPDGKSLREIRQIVVVQPGRRYTFTGFYRADIRSAARPAWQVVDPAGEVIASARLDADPPDWQEFSAAFTVPHGTDRVLLRLGVENCGASICPIAGNVWFDDFSLTSKQP
jgi:Tfp pilus assembly protein PilF